MKAGALRHLLTLQSSSTSTSRSGEATISYTTEGKAWGSVEPLSGRELEWARQSVANVSHRIRLRYNPNYSVAPNWRCTFGSRAFYFASVLNMDERNRELEILAVEIV